MMRIELAFRAANQAAAAFDQAVTIASSDLGQAGRTFDMGRAFFAQAIQAAKSVGATLDATLKRQLLLAIECARVARDDAWRALELVRRRA